jgi:hypothetical protein
VGDVDSTRTSRAVRPLPFHYEQNMLLYHSGACIPNATGWRVVGGHATEVNSAVGRGVEDTIGTNYELQTEILNAYCQFLNIQFEHQHLLQQVLSARLARSWQKRIKHASGGVYYLSVVFDETVCLQFRSLEPATLACLCFGMGRRYPNHWATDAPFAR